MSENRKVFKNSLLYSVSSLLTKAIGFLMLPVYTRLVETDGYGAINLATSFVAVSSYLAALSLYSAILRFTTDYEDDHKSLRRFFSTVLTALFVTASVFVGLCLVFKAPLNALMFKGVPFYPIVLIAIGVTFFSVMHTAHATIMQAMQQGEKLALVNICVSGAQVVLTLLFLIVFKLGAAGVLLAQFSVYVLYFIYIFVDLGKRKLFRFGVDFQMLKTALKYSIPIMPHNLSMNIASLASKILLNNASDLSSVGLYGTASQFGDAIDTIQSAANRAFMPWFFGLLKRGDSDRQSIADVTKTLLLFYSLLYMVIGLFSEEVLVLLTAHSYHEAWRAIPLIVAAFSVKSIYYFEIDVLMYHPEAAKRMFLATVTGSLADILLAAVLVQYFGMYGSAAAFLIAKLITVAIITLMSKKYDDQPLSAWNMAAIIAPSLIFLGVGLLPSYLVYETGFHWGNVGVKLFVLALYLGLIAWTNKGLVKSAREMYRQWRTSKRGGAQ